jgi:hypothetical protein
VCAGGVPVPNVAHALPWYVWIEGINGVQAHCDPEQGATKTMQAK